MFGKALFIILLIVSINVSAEEINYHIHLGSYHFHDREDDKEWNEINPGIGFEKHGSYGYYGAGYFRNSYDKNSFYVKTGIDFDDMNMGFFIGAATGYEDEGSPVFVGWRFYYKNINLHVTPFNAGFSYRF